MRKKTEDLARFIENAIQDSLEIKGTGLHGKVYVGSGEIDTVKLASLIVMELDYPLISDAIQRQRRLNRTGIIFSEANEAEEVSVLIDRAANSIFGAALKP